mmetsp:Transcript_13854/g.11829  ORF Transcript_13854/g.11829 Transcript_13854/m.11829 type:complete len:119 (+) Transcript_13854:2233-2589(+)
MTVDYTMFPTDLGLGINNGDLLDCTPTGIPALECKLSLGAAVETAPVSIIMETPAINIPANTQIDVEIPLIQVPLADRVRTEARIYTREFDGVNTFNNVEEYLRRVIFVTRAFATDTA